MALTSGERSALWRKRQREDPVKYAEYKRKERERYKKKKDSGQVKSVEEMSRRERRRQRKQWKHNQRAKRNRDKTQQLALENQITPPTSPEFVQPEHNSRKTQGRKKKNLNRSAAYRVQFNLRIQLNKERRLKEKYKKRCFRMKQKISDDEISMKVKETIARKETLTALTMHNVIINNIKTRYQRAKREEKRIIRNLVFRESLLKRYKIASYAQLAFNIIENRKVPAYTKKYSKVRPVIKEKIEKFYERDDNSRTKAGKKATITRCGIKKQIRLLNDTVKNIHKKYLLENKTRISYSLFARFKPFWVIKASEKDRETCLCKLHENPRLKINRLYAEKIIESKDIESFVRDITCSSTSKACMYRECPHCMGKKIQTKKIPGKVVDWYFWTTRKVPTDKQVVHEDGNSKKHTKTVTLKQKETTSIDALIEALQIDIERICRHIFNINHQYVELKYLKDNCPEDEVIVHIDFSENYMCKYSEEITSTHFGASKRQISIHTGVAYLSNKTISFASISDCLEHGPGGIWAHLDPVIQYIRTVSTAELKKIHFISDGPTTQYRSRTNFFLASQKVFKYGFIGGTWNFLEAGHGKGAPDGVGAVIKRLADNLVNTREYDVTNATDLIQGLKEMDSSVRLFKIEEEDVNKIKNEIPSTIEAVPDTMKIHQVMMNERSEIQSRVLSCFCTASCSCYNPVKTSFTIPEQTRSARNEETQNLLTVPDDFTESLVNKYCVVEYDGLPYPGRVLDVDEDSVEVTAMNRIGVNRFYWPQFADELWYTKDKFITLLDSEPEKVTGRHMQLPKEIWDAISKKMNLVTK